jgi:hypothetical protein
MLTLHGCPSFISSLGSCVVNQHSRHPRHSAMARSYHLYHLYRLYHPSLLPFHATLPATFHACVMKTGVSQPGPTTAEAAPSLSAVGRFRQSSARTSADPRQRARSPGTALSGSSRSRWNLRWNPLSRSSSRGASQQIRMRRSQWLKTCCCELRDSSELRVPVHASKQFRWSWIFRPPSVGPTDSHITQSIRGGVHADS